MRMFLIVVSVAVLALAGCGKKDEKKGDAKGAKGAKGDSGAFNCENLAKRNQQCADDMVKVFMDSLGEKIPAELKEKIAKRRKEGFLSDRWKERCEKRWSSDKPRHKAQKEAMEKCFGIKDCKEYAKCFADSMFKGRRRRMKAAP